MGHSFQGWKFFSLPNAYAAGFILPDELIDWDGRNGKWAVHVIYPGGGARSY